MIALAFVTVVRPHASLLSAKCVRVTVYTCLLYVTLTEMLPGDHATHLDGCAIQ